MNWRLVSGLAAVLFVMPVALGDTTIGSLNNIGYNSSSGHTLLGQRFIVPAGETGLVSGSLVLHDGNSGDSNGYLRLYTFSDDGFTGTLGTQLGAGAITVLNGSGTQTYSYNFNVPVVAGNKYALLADWGSSNNAGGYFSNSSYYSDGMMILSTDGIATVLYPSYDMAFEVTFGQIPEPAMLGVIASLGLLLGRRARGRG